MDTLLINHYLLTYLLCNTVGCNMLHVFGHPVMSLATLLCRIVTCYKLDVAVSNLKMVKFFMQHLWMLHDV